MVTDEMRLNAITEKVIGCAYRVGTKLGGGFAEKCYQNALMFELNRSGLVAEAEVKLEVWYVGVVVGEFYADIIVEGLVILELKSIAKLDAIHAAQCINYLAATRLPLCLLINFARRVEVKRIAGPSLRTMPETSIEMAHPIEARDLMNDFDNELAQD